MKTKRNLMLALAAAVMLSSGSGIIQPEGDIPEGPIVFTELAGMLMSCYHTNGVELAPAGCYVI